jgi:hypothetical protein
MTITMKTTLTQKKYARFALPASYFFKLWSFDKNVDGKGLMELKASFAP